ncbi:MAG TPA: biopolymer transporter ExbD [Kofleriaceae bacterium]|nr:biopolymer transporter ExbD [Kofleriaceae bacterium]
MAAASLDSDEISGINVTPLVDIMLVLLIIFMIATKLDQPGAIDVQLPHAATATELQHSTLAIVVHRDGSMHLDGAAVTLTGIEAAASRTAPDGQALVSADKGVDYEHVVAVMDALRKGGVSKLALPTELEDAR